MVREVLLSDDFKQEIRKLGKRRRQIGTDLKKLVRKFDDNALPGRRCRGADGLPFKSVRMTDKSSGKGSSGGFRVTYKYTCSTVFLLRVVLRKDEDFIPRWRFERLAKQYGCDCDSDE